MSPAEKFRGLPSYIKMGIVGFITVMSFVGGVWAIDDRYVTQQEVVASLQTYDTKVQSQIQQIEKDNKMKDYSNLTDQYYQQKRMMNMYPDDQELRQDFERIKQRREELRKELHLQ